MVQINFNANDVPPASGFAALPAGDSTAILEGCEQRTTQKGDGSYLKLTFVVVEGDFANRKLWANLNIENPSEEAQKIGRAELSALCRAVGVLDLKDTDELLNKPLRLKVKIEPDKRTPGEMRNVVKGYFAAGDNAKPQVAGLVTNGSSKPAGPARPAWAQK